MSSPEIHSASAQPLAVRAGSTQVPTVYWTPPSPRGILLACHGGSGHKLSPAILKIVDVSLPRGIAVLAIDGPVQGERRTDGSLEPKDAIQSFREAWRAGVGRVSMAAEMSAALDALLALPAFQGLPVGYMGVSMGTAYGLPLLASEKRIQAAAIGLWSTTYAASEHLADFARSATCPVWFTQQWNDEFFDRDGTLALFDAIGSTDKRAAVYPGPHRELEGERLLDAITFIERKLALAA